MLIVKLMRSFEENEKEARALRQRMAGRDELAAEKEAVQASSQCREVHVQPQPPACACNQIN